MHMAEGPWSLLLPFIKREKERKLDAYMYLVKIHPRRPFLQCNLDIKSIFVPDQNQRYIISTLFDKTFIYRLIGR